MAIIEVLDFLNLDVDFSYLVIFSMIIVIFWLIMASIQDFRKREVENWWSFSLIVILLVLRAFFSIESFEMRYLIWGVVGLGVGFILGNLFYYSRAFAGGDAKLLMAITIGLCLSFNWKVNLSIVSLFLICILVSGAFYGVMYSLILVLKNRKELSKNINKRKVNRNMLTISIILGLIFILFSLILKEYAFIVFGVVIFILPYLLKFAESLEEAAMKKNIKVSRLTIGDWLAREVRVGKKIIKPNWEGLNEKELKIIRGSKIKRVWVKEGIPFVPVFLIAFIILVVIIKIYNG